MLQDFVKRYEGRSGVGDTPDNKGECVGLVQVFINELGLPHVWGHAKDLLNNADKNAYTVILNTPANFPLPGDIVVWNKNMGSGFGHTAIVLDANTNTLTVFEQNNPIGAACRIATYSYNNVVGWFRPKTLPATWNEPPAEEHPDYYKGLDLKNIESMKVAVDVWERATKGELVDKQQFETQLDATNQCQIQLKEEATRNKELEIKLTALQKEFDEVKSKDESKQSDVEALDVALDKITTHNSDLLKENSELATANNQYKRQMNSLGDLFLTEKKLEGDALVEQVVADIYRLEKLEKLQAKQEAEKQTTGLPPTENPVSTSPAQPQQRLAVNRGSGKAPILQAIGDFMHLFFRKK